MVSHNWNFDGQDIPSSEGAVLQWEDHRYFTLTYKGKAFHGELLDNQSESNYLKLKLNHRVFEVRKKGPLDELIAAMGLDVPKVKKLKELAAPMPGRIVNIAVEIGQELQVGDDILSLEAMKMENVLKAEGVGIVKEIRIQTNDVVVKGAVLIEFE